MNTAVIAAISTAIGVVLAKLGQFVGGLIKAAKSKNEVREQEYEHTENLVKLTSGQANDIKDEISAIRKDVFELTQTQVMFNKMYLRHSILQVYFTHESDKTITMAEWESVLGLYDVYTSLGGNGFVHEKVDEMKTWEKV